MVMRSDSVASVSERGSIRGRLCSGRSWMGYALAAAAVVLAALLKWGLTKAFGDLPLFVTFYPVVALVAMLLGAWPGVLAVILSALAADYFFVPPIGSLGAFSLNNAVALGLFLAAGLLVCWMAELLDRARRRHAASERESLLQAISEGIPDSLFLKDRDGRMVIANAATVRAIGRPAGQIIGHTDEEFFDPAVARALMADDRRVMESGQAATLEDFMPGPDGGRTFLTIKTPWRDSEGRIIGVIGCARDITERKRAEEALRESEERFRAIFDHAALGIVEVDAQGRFIAASDRVRQILGYTPEELLGKTTRELTYPEDQPVGDDLNARLFDGRLDHFDCEKRYLKRDGTPLWVHLTASAVRDAAGRFLRAIGTVEDITARKRDAEALRESEARFQALAAGTFEGIVITEAGRIQDTNEQMARMLGYEPAELIGMEVEVMIPPEVREEVLGRIRAGQESHDEHDLIRKDGTRVAVEIHGKNITYRNRSVRITAIHDISERKRADEALRRYELLAAHSRDIILFIDRNSGRILEANAAAEATYGYSREQLLEMTLHDLRADSKMAVSLMTQADAWGSLFETQHRRRDGSTFPVEVSSRGATIGGRRTLISVVRDITERKRAEEALRESEQRWRAFFEQAAVGTASADPTTGRFQQVNSRYCEITGYEPAELLRMSFADVTHPEDRTRDREKYDRLARGEAREYLAEKRYVRKDGRVIWVQVAVGMVRDAQGRAVQSVGVIQDITQRKQGEEALRESEASLAAAQRLAHIGSWEWDVVNDRARWSDETFRIFGVPRGQLHRHRGGFVGMIHPEDRQRVDQALSDALGGTREYNLDYRIRHPDGSERVIHAQAEVLRDGSGKPLLMRGTVHDITERQQAEEALRRSRQDLDRAQAVGQMGWWRLDTRRNVLTWSEETYRIFGVPSGTPLTYEMFLDTIHPDDRQYVGNCWTAALHGEPYDIEHRILVEGRIRWVREKAYLEVDGTGELRGGFGISQDITDRKQAEQQLKELNETLEARVAERTAIAERRTEQMRALAARLTKAEQKERQRLASILHDHLQQLLASTKFHLASVRRRVQDPQQRESLEQVGSLLDDSLATSRSLMLDLSPPILQHGDMRQVLEWLAGWFASKHGLTVEVQADDQANPQSQEVRVLLLEVVRELLFNVVKHAKVSRACVTLGLADSGRVKAIVRDEGAGFGPAQAPGGQQDATGFGLLSIRERVDWLGGEFQIESAPGRGTSVTVIVPMGLESRAASQGEPTPVSAMAGLQAPGAGGAAAGKVRLLLADDHKVVRTGLAELLQQEPWIEVVGQASDGRQAVEAALRIRPDVVLMDVSMPGMDGVEATRLIVTQCPEMKVIGLSMLDEAGVVEAMKAAGAVNYVLKSSGPDEMIAAVRGCTNRAGAVSKADAGS